MDRVISLSVGEIALKGKNRKYFENKLISHVKRVLQGLPFGKIYKEQGKIYVEVDEDSLNEVINRVKRYLGFITLVPA